MNLEIILNLLWDFKWYILGIGYSLAFILFIYTVNNNIKKEKARQ